MIEVFNRWLEALSDAELDFLRSKVYEEMSKRDAAKRAQFGNNPELNDNEQWLIRQGRKIDAIKAYRSRSGHSLKESKDAVEHWMNANGIQP